MTIIVTKVVKITKIYSPAVSVPANICVLHYKALSSG